MKFFVSIFAPLLFASFANAQETTIDLKGIDEERRDYGKQLVAEFWKMIEANGELKKEFDSYSLVARERSGGKSMGPDVQPLIVKRSEEVDFQNSGGWRKYAQTIALYCSFAEGFHKGMQADTGVFAVFEIKGIQTYDHKGGDDFELRDHKVTAEFKGFQTTLAAPQDAAGQPAVAGETQ